jgi:hypothetical protein
LKSLQFYPRFIPLGPDGGDRLAGGEVGLGHANMLGGRRLGSPATDWWRWIGWWGLRRAAAAAQRRRARGKFDDGEGKAWAQPRVARGASMRPREGTRQVQGLREAAEERARRRRSGGGCGGSGSGEWVAQLDQHVARGGVVVHTKGLELLGARGNRLEHGAHRAAAMADGGGSGRNACARGTAGTGL